MILRTLDDGDDGETLSFEGLNRCDQCADADNRVIDVLWKFIPDFGANFVLGFAFVTIRRNEAYEVRHRFNVPYEHVWHVRRLAYIAAYTDSLCG